MGRRGELARQRDLTRRGPVRERKARFLLFCEGEVTEREYFEYLRRTLRDPVLQIEISKDRGDPLGLVRAAADKKARSDRAARRDGDINLRFEEVWCIVDVDTHVHLPEAVELAATTGISMAISTPCFEIWPLLHLHDQRAYLSSTQAVAALGRCMPGYDKHLDCAALDGMYEIARSRAQRLDKMHAKNGTTDRNPSSDVWHLVDSMLAAASARRS